MPLVGIRLDGSSAVVLLAVAMAVFAVGECLHGAVQAPLVADLAEPRLLGRYMALSALSWQIGFVLGPAIGGFALAFAPHGVWLAAAVICLVNGAAALALEPRIPQRARRTPARGDRVSTGRRGYHGERDDGYRRPAQYRMPSLPRISRRVRCPRERGDRRADRLARPLSSPPAG